MTPPIEKLQLVSQGFPGKRWPARSYITLSHQIRVSCGKTSNKVTGMLKRKCFNQLRALL